MVAKDLKKIWIITFSLFFCQQLSAFVPNAVTDIITISDVTAFNNPQGIAITSDNSKVYVCNYGGNTVSIIDIATNSWIGNVKDTNQYIQSPQSIVISADGHTAYVTCNATIPNGQSNNLGGIAIIDLNAAHTTTYNTVTGLVTDASNTFNAPYGIAINPHLVSGVYYAYVTNYSGNTVSIINTTTNAVVTTVTDTGNLINTPGPIAITPTAVGGKYYAYVGNVNAPDNNHTVIIIDLTSSDANYNKVTGNVDAGSISYAIASITAIAFMQNAINGVYYACVVDAYSGSFIYINISTASAISTVLNIGGYYYPTCIAIDPTNTYACVSGGSAVIVITLSNEQIITQITDTVNNGANACAISPNGKYLYVTNSNNTVSKITLFTNNPEGQISPSINTAEIVFAPGLQSVAITPDGKTAYVGTINGGVDGYGYMSVVDIATQTVIQTVTDTDNVLSPVAIAMTKDRTTAYAANSSNNQSGVVNIGIVDLVSNAVSNHIPLEGISDVYCSALTQDDSKLYVGTNSGIVVIDTATNTTKTIANTANTTSLAMQFGTSYAYAVVNNSSIKIIDTTTDTVTDITISDPYSNISGPMYIAISQDGTTACVINAFIQDNFGQYLVFINLVDTPPSLVATCGGNGINNPSSVVFSPDGSTLYVMNTNSIIVVDVSLTEISSIIIDSSFRNYDNTLLLPYIMAITPDGTTGYVVNSGNNNNVSVVALQQAVQPPTSAVQPPASMDVKTKLNSFLQYTDIVNLISWTVPTTGLQAAAYQIYRDAQLTDLITTVNGVDPLLYLDRHLQANTTYSYYIVSLDSLGNLSEPITMSITT